MKIALLGAMGFVGQAAARELAARPEVRELILVDYDVRRAKKLAKALSPKCRYAMADAGRRPELERLLGGLDAVANAVGPCAEYETGILATCAAAGTAVASIGDGPLAEADRREIHETVRRAGIPAVSGSGLLPGWTELLSAHFLSARGERTLEGTRRFLFCSPDRFGGYAFFRRMARTRRQEPVPPPPNAPRGVYFATEAGDLLGFPEGAAVRYRRIGRLCALGPVGREFAAAFHLWLRGSPRGAAGTPAAAAGVVAPAGAGFETASVTDPDGRLAGATLARAALLLAGSRGNEKGLLPLPLVIGREEAERIAASCGARIVLGRVQGRS
ncbi:MAG: saccharopine dehydrogenase NADP-binding domain-containing protein [Gemmatimonadota bacterium]